MEINEESAALLAKKPTNAKAAIIKKLSHNWPITAKAMALALQREFGIEITYQGVHKALTQLEEEKIIEKGEKGYQLDKNWIDSVSNLANQIQQNYTSNESVDFDKEIIQLTYRNWLSMGRFIIYRFEKEYPNPQKKPSICNWMHVWPSLTLSAEENIEVKNIHELDPHYSLCSNDTPLDRYFANLMNQLSKNCQTGNKILLSGDIVVKGDYIAQIFYDEEFYKEVDNFYKKNGDPAKIDFNELRRLATTETQIQILIIKNQVLADKIRKETLKHFRKTMN